VRKLSIGKDKMTSATPTIDPTNPLYDSALTLLRVRLSECGESLHRFFMVLVFTTGEKTTAQDAFAAWRVWLHQQSGTPETELHPNEFSEHCAVAIRLVARQVARPRP
jgi:hypothetical protein